MPYLRFVVKKCVKKAAVQALQNAISEVTKTDIMLYSLDLIVM